MNQSKPKFERTQLQLNPIHSYSKQFQISLLYLLSINNNLQKPLPNLIKTFFSIHTHTHTKDKNSTLE